MYIFNPENDLALANFTIYYTPPASAVKLAADLSVLPLWYAPDQSLIVAHPPIDTKFVREIQQRFGLKSFVIPFSDIPVYFNRCVKPWGWSPLLKQRLKNIGIKEEQLPAPTDLELLRTYSNRKNAVNLLRELKTEYPQFCGESFYFTTIDQLLDYLSVTDADQALKMPLSGSGRGLIWILGEITDKQTDWARRVVENQGGVVAEPKLERVQDFAMEFTALNGAINFEGYSLFETAASGAYTGNVLMPDADIENQLSEYVSIELLHQLRQSLLQKLTDYFPKYDGVLGVDMMICNTNDGYRLHPCVEVNMRMNMGMAAHRFYERFVCSGSKGHYRVDYFKKTGEALLHHQKMGVDFPLTIENGKILSGYMSLTPVHEDTNYVAWVLINSV